MTISKFETEIPKKIKGIVQDFNWNDIFIFEDMDCEHGPEAKEHIKINCEKCQFDKRELWLEEKLNSMSGNETIKDIDNKIHKISKITVVRGKYQDCIGLNYEY